jgi:hypothetical protein
MHFVYAILTFVGLAFLRGNFRDSALKWWTVAILIQVWHLLEHTLLFVQASGRFTLWGAKEPTSILQLFFPRIELHLFYNSVVTIPIIIALVLDSRSRRELGDIVSVAATENSVQLH